MARDRKDWLKHTLSDFLDPHLLTLTVDRAGTLTGKGFEGPEAAFVYVMGLRLLGRLMGSLGFVRWVAVLEFQSEGGGWPHWHVVCDGRVDLQRARELWRHRWKVGELQVERVKSRGGVCGYLRGYLVKTADAPDWVKGRCGVRIISASRHGGIVGFDDFVKGKRRVRGGRESSGRRARTVAEVVAGCGRSCTVLEVNEADASVRFLGSLNVSLRTVRRCLDRAGVISIPKHETQVLSWLRLSRERWIPGWARVTGLRAIEVDLAELRDVLGRFGLKFVSSLTPPPIRPSGTRLSRSGGGGGERVGVDDSESGGANSLSQQARGVPERIFSGTSLAVVEDPEEDWSDGDPGSRMDVACGASISGGGRTESKLAYGCVSEGSTGTP